MLHELSELTILDEGDPQSFRVRAYESAAQAITAEASDLGRLTLKELQTIEGIGKSTAEKIRELLETGQGREARGAAPEASARASSRCCASRAWGRRRSRGCAPSSASARSTTCAACWPSTSCASSRASAQKSEEKLAQALARLDAQGAVGPHADLGRAAARDAHRRAPARGAGRHARVVLRLAAPLLGDDRRRRHRGRRARAGAGDGGARRDDARRSRARCAASSKTSVVTRRGTQVDLRVVAPQPARRRAALLHRLEGAQHQAAPARARARADAERIRAVRGSRRAR